MTKYLGNTWVEWVCIFVAVIIADIAVDTFNTEWYWKLVIFGIVWFIGFTVTYLIINQILKWTGKN